MENKIKYCTECHKIERQRYIPEGLDLSEKEKQNYIYWVDSDPDLLEVIKESYSIKEVNCPDCTNRSNLEQAMKN